jgi:hypothetical protein
MDSNQNSVTKRLIGCMSGFIVVKYEQTLPGENDGEAARMTGLYLLLPRLLTIFASFLVVRSGAIELRMTGMDAEKASFQALSAFTRTGFSTREAELVLNNRQRRRIVT